MRERSTKHDRPRSRDPAGNDQELNRSGESLGEFIQRGVLIAVGVVLLLVDGFRTPLWTLVGATFTLGAIVTFVQNRVQPIDHSNSRERSLP